MQAPYQTMAITQDERLAKAATGAPAAHLQYTHQLQQQQHNKEPWGWGLLGSENGGGSSYHCTGQHAGQILVRQTKSITVQRFASLLVEMAPKPHYLASGMHVDWSGRLAWDQASLSGKTLFSSGHATTT